MINKKTLTIVSGLFVAGLFIWNYIGNYHVCDFFVKGSSAGSCPFILTDIGINLIPIIPLFLFSLLTYFMRDDVYRAWARFSYVWIPFSMALVFFAPEYSGDWMFPVTKGTVAFMSSLLFALISLTLIIWKYFLARKAHSV